MGFLKDAGGMGHRQEEPEVAKCGWGWGGWKVGAGEAQHPRGGVAVRAGCRLTSVEGLPPALHHTPGRAHFGAFRVTPSCRFTEDSGSRGTGRVPGLGLIRWKGEAQAHLLSCREEREDKCGKEALNRTAG